LVDLLCRITEYTVHAAVQLHIMLTSSSALVLLLLLFLQPGLARPEIIAEVASSLADMLYASEKLVDAKGALQVCYDCCIACYTCQLTQLEAPPPAITWWPNRACPTTM
jgi:hypothetical protein